MVLRRLMSGWLIALAAVARATASALERAAAEPSALAVDPVLADLVERYPDAPAHWLAFMANCMSQEADAVEMSSALAESAAERVSAPESLLAITRGSMSIDAPPPSDSPIAPGFRPARRREEVTVPSLAELTSRSSEVWRRPATQSNRPSRPIFARPAEAATMAVTSGNDAPTAARRPRTPLTAATHAAPGISPNRSPPDSASFGMPPSTLGRPLAAPTQSARPSIKSAMIAPIPTTPNAQPARHAPNVQPARNAPNAQPARNASNDPSSGATETAWDEPSDEPSEVRSATAASKAASATAPRGSFFSPRSRPPSPSRSSNQEPTAGTARPPPRDPTVAEAEAPHARIAPARPLGAVRSAARRAMVRTVAALRQRVASVGHHQTPASAPPTVASPTIARRPGRSASPRSPTSVAAREHGTSPTEIRGPRADGREALVEAAVEAAPSSQRQPAGRRDDDMTRGEPSSAPGAEPRARDFAPAVASETAPRFSFAARRASPALGWTHGASASSDDRWPSLPPSVPPPPPEVEAPAPRWSRLARDQEEGLWNA